MTTTPSVITPINWELTDSGYDLIEIFWAENNWFTHSGDENSFSVGDYLKIEDEELFVTSSGEDNFGFGYCTVERGLSGTDVVQHDDHADIYVYIEVE